MEKVYVLVFRNYLSVSSMQNNLIPPFVIIEAGMVVKDTSRIHAMDPSVENNSIYFPNLNIIITLFIHGVFSYFTMSKSSLTTLGGTDEIYLMIPGGIWNPGSDTYTKSE